MKGPSHAFVIGALAFALGLTACQMPEGDFDGIEWTPLSTQFAVADRHQIIEVQGALQATQRPHSAQSLTLLLTDAGANPHLEWRRSTSRTLLTLRQDLATTDGLLLYNIPLSLLTAGAELRRYENTGETDEPRDFDAAIVVRHEADTADERQGLGDDLEMTLTIDEVDAEPFGFVNGRFELKRGRSEDQSGEVATGNVSLSFQLPVVAERRGKANLAIATPIMGCAAEKGPAQAGTCIAAPAATVAEASDGIAGF